MDGEMVRNNVRGKIPASSSMPLGTGTLLAALCKRLERAETNEWLRRVA